MREAGEVEPDTSKAEESGSGMDPALQQLQSSMEGDEEALQMLQVLQRKMAAKQQATSMATANGGDNEGDAGMGGDSQVPATAPTGLPTQADTGPSTGTPAASAAVDIAALRAEVDAANAQAAASVAQLSEFRQLSAARDSELAVVRQQLELVQALPPSQPAPAAPADVPDETVRTGHVRDRSRSEDRRQRAENDKKAEKRKDEAKGKVLCR